MACVSINCVVHGCDDCSVNDGAGTPTNFGTATAGVDDILKADIDNLRNALDAELVRRGGAAYGWAAVITVAVTDIDNDHFNEIVTATNSADQFPTQPCTTECGAHAGVPDACSNVATGSYAQGNDILAADINELRGWVNDLEGACVCNNDCGTDDYCLCVDDCGLNYP